MTSGQPRVPDEERKRRLEQQIDYLFNQHPMSYVESKSDFEAVIVRLRSGGLWPLSLIVSKFREIYTKVT